MNNIAFQDSNRVAQRSRLLVLLSIRTLANSEPAQQPQSAEPTRYTLPRLGTVEASQHDITTSDSSLLGAYRPPRLIPVPQKPATVPKPAAVHIEQQPPKKPPAPTKSQVPQVDNFWTTYHPSSGRPTKYDVFENYGTRPSNPLPFDDKPWLPFHSEIEFVFAKIMLDCAISNKNVNALINVVRALLESRGLFEVKDHKDLENLWTSAAGMHGLAPFEPSEVKVLYQNRSHIHMLWSRPLMSWIVNVLEDTFLASVINWDAIQTDKFDGKDWIPFMTEPWTARRMWKFQVEDEPSEEGKTEWVNFKKAVWHESFKILLHEVAIYSKTGIEVKCSDGIFRRIYPFIFLLAADYEEQYVV
ncbi:hypothetical protein DXG01_003681 [Tephrocybe rancida]|nr:hypothetical protein DXG01_003681 [Tephrocybe rancida]